MLTTLIVFGLTVVTGMLGWLVKELIVIKTDVAEVKAQHQNNGGSTLRDAVDRIERKQDETAKTVSEHLIEAAEARADLRNHLVSHGAATVVVQPVVPARPSDRS